MRTRFLGMPVDLLSLDDTVDRARSAMRGRTHCRHTALNVAKLVNARSDPNLDADIRDADIIGIDGMGIAFGLRLLGTGTVERIPGADLFDVLMDVCAKDGFRPYFLGATDAVLNDAVGVLMQRHPGLAIAGVQSGYFSREDELTIVADIQRSGADCLFVAMPSPRKERFLAAHGAALAIPFVMGIGGTLDVISGKTRRAPKWAQRVGLEWAFRLAQEPRRLMGRYARTNTIYAALLTAGIAKRAAGLGMAPERPATRARAGTKH